MANSNDDIIRVDKVMIQEVANLVADMVASSPSEVNFFVGGKKDEYRRIFIDEIERKALILLQNRSERIIF